MLLLLRDEESESEDSETGNYSEVDDLEEAGGILLLPVGEGDIEVEGLGAIGIELELSGSGGGEGRVGVLDTGEGDPEVSGDALALAPLLWGDFVGNVWLSVGGVLNGLCGGEASSVVCLCPIKLPSVELVIYAKAGLGGPGNVEVLSESLIVDSIWDLGVAASGDCAISAWAIDGEVDDTSANCEVVGLCEINEVGSAVVISILEFIGSARTNDGVHLILKGTGANVAISNTGGSVNLSLGVFVFHLANFRKDGVVHGSTDGNAVVISTSDARCAVETSLEGDGSLLVLGEDARAKEGCNSKSYLSRHFKKDSFWRDIY